MNDIKKLGDAGKYQQQADAFLEKHNMSIDIDFANHKRYFYNDTKSRNIYNVTITNLNNHQSMNFSFGASLATGDCNYYDVLRTLDIHDFKSFKDFIWEFGYEEGSQASKKMYNKLTDQDSDIKRVFSDDAIEDLGLIQ